MFNKQQLSSTQKVFKINANYITILKDMFEKRKKEEREEKRKERKKGKKGKG